VVDRRAIGPALPLLLGAIVLLDQVLALGAVGIAPRSTAPLVPRLLGGLATVAVLSGVLLVGRWTWLRSGLARRHPSLGLLSVGLAVQIGLAVGRRVVEPGAVDARPGYAFDEFVFLVGATLVVLLLLSALARHRARRNELEAAAADLRSALTTSTAGLAEERARLTSHVRELLEQRLGPTSLRPALFTPERLREVAEDVLRPLSHQLANAGALPSTELRGTARDGTVPRARLSEVLRCLDVSPTLRPRLLAATMLLLTFRFSISAAPEAPSGEASSAVLLAADSVMLTVDSVAFLRSLSFQTATFLIVLIGARLVARWMDRPTGSALPDSGSPPRRRGTRGWSIVVAGLLGLGLVSLALLRGALTLAGIGTLPPLTVGSIAAFTAPLLAMTVVTSLLPAIESALGETREPLTTLNVQLAAATARHRALLEHERRLFARQLHSSVQPAVNAARLMIERATRDGHIDQAIVAAAADTIEASVQRLLDAEDSGADDRADGATALDARLNAITATWEGLAQVTFELEASVRAHLRADPVARATLCDVIAEACANAVIHGNAGDISVVVRAEDYRGGATDGPLTAVDLRVTDDGRARSAQQGQGLGSRILTASCVSWHLDHRDDGTVLTAVLPVRWVGSVLAASELAEPTGPGRPTSAQGASGTHRTAASSSGRPATTRHGATTPGPNGEPNGRPHQGGAGQDRTHTA